MILTREEFDQCSQWEQKFRNAQAGVLHTLGRAGVEAIKTIYTRVTGRPAPRADSCGSCELRLQKQLAMWYFSDKGDYERRKEGKAVKAAGEVAKKAARKSASNANKVA